MGGVSPEHPVSLASGCGVLSRIDAARFDAFPVLVSRENQWVWPKRAEDVPKDLDPEGAGEFLREPPSGWGRCVFPGLEGRPDADVYFLALHGVGGEDGVLQERLEQLGQPFTGSRSAGCRNAMDKIRSKELYRAHGIPTAAWITLRSGEDGAADRVVREIGLPAVLKQPEGGSSIGVAIVKSREQLDQALRELGSDSGVLLAEAFVRGKECSCGVLEGFDPVLPPTEIRPKEDGFFSFEAKYQAGRTDEITPAEFPHDVVVEIQRHAAAAHAALGLSVYSRTDFIWDGTGVWALETNNLPGFTPTSLLPQQAAHCGMGYSELVSHVIDESLRQWRGE